MGAGVRGGIVGVGPVLHLCSDYARQRLYPQLMSALDDAGVAQSVYVPVRTREETDVPGPPRQNIRFYARHVLRPYHRLLFTAKLRVVNADLAGVEDPRRFGLVHAHFLYSDGGVAHRLHVRYGLPYVAAIRNTDLNVFMRLRPDLRSTMHRIVASASGLIFLAPAYREQFLARLPEELARTVSGRCRVIPNGLEAPWLAAPPSAVDRTGAPLRVLYVGDFTPNKNVLRLMEAAARVAAHRAVELTLVGGGGEGAAPVDAALSSGRFPFVRHLGPVRDDECLRELYRAHDMLAMPSLRETFGLVYIEALSQGTPVLLSKGQGVDGYFPHGAVAHAVDPLSVDDIVRGIDLLAARGAGQRAACISAAQPFAWPRIAQTYRELYSSVARIPEAA
jgi:glycosyltransferase involved in cell wall biosynthesis